MPRLARLLLVAALLLPGALIATVAPAAAQEPHLPQPAVQEPVRFTAWSNWATYSEFGGFRLELCKPLLAGDVNGDRLTDLICPYVYAPLRAATWVQVSTGTSFETWSRATPLDDSRAFDLDRCRRLQTGDFNGDGLSDLVCPYDFGNASTATYVQTFANGSGSEWLTWRERTPSRNFDLNLCVLLESGDINGDHRDDLTCVYRYPDNSTSTFVQISQGASFDPWRRWSQRIGAGTTLLANCTPLLAGDFNGDGLTDIICPSDFGNGATATLAQLSLGTAFAPWNAYSERSPDGTLDLERCKPLHVGDANGDGLADLICPVDYGSASTATWVQLSEGDRFASWSQWSSRTPNGNFALGLCKSLQTGDVNGDARTDLICPYDYGSSSTATFVQISDGTGYSVWRTWAARTAPGKFALDLCSPLLVGTVNAGRAADLICPYNSGNGATATFVQSTEAYYEAFVPVVAR